MEEVYFTTTTNTAKSLQVLQSGYWGRVAMDPEAGRCWRTDGKKWTCSRDVVTGQKYCERHVHRGRNRSRKLVEMPPTSNSSGVTVANNNAATRSGGGASGNDANGCVVVKASSPMNDIVSSQVHWSA